MRSVTPRMDLTAKCELLGYNAILVMTFLACFTALFFHFSAGFYDRLCETEHKLLKYVLGFIHAYVAPIIFHWLFNIPTIWLKKFTEVYRESVIHSKCNKCGRNMLKKWKNEKKQALLSPTKKTKRCSCSQEWCLLCD